MAKRIIDTVNAVIGPAAVLYFVGVAALFLAIEVARGVVWIGSNEFGLPFTMTKRDTWVDVDDSVHSEQTHYPAGIVGNVVVYYGLALLLAWHRRRRIAARNEHRARLEAQRAGAEAGRSPVAKP